MEKEVKPMLAGKFDPDKQRYPCYVQPKYDGIRAIISDGQALSRTLKPIRNAHIQQWAHDHRMYLDGMDGELVVGLETAEDCFRVSSSGIMSEGGKPDFKYIIFDHWRPPSAPFADRLGAIRIMEEHSAWPEKAELAETWLIQNEVTLMDLHQMWTSRGYEGTIIRAPEGRYKFNRSTTNEGLLLKLKDFKDAEATITGFQEKMHNANPEFKDERGYAAHSAHQENMVSQGTLGALEVAFSPQEDENMIEFNIGTGFDDALRQNIWNTRRFLLGKIVKFKYFEGGKYDAPRFPVFLGFRDKIDFG